jgi:uncharacterized protein YbjT (DUF2867 family)
MTNKIAVVAGATGLVGRELVRQLCAHNDYASVIALVRQPQDAVFPEAGSKLIVRGLPAGDEHIEGDEFYCALGTTIKKAGSQAAFKAVDHDLVLDLAKRAKAGGVGRVVVVTAIGSDPNSKIFYSRVKGETERDLQALELKKLEIYRPSLLLGQRQESRLAEGLAIAMAPAISWLCQGPLLKYRPITAQDLARLMIAGERIFGQ